MNDNIHGTFSGEIEQKPSWRDGSVFKTLEALRPWIQWAMIAIMAIFVWYQGQRDTNAQQTINVADIQREQSIAKQSLADYKSKTDDQFQTLRKEMLTRELAEAWRAADVERMSRIEKSIEMIAVRP